MILTVQPRGRRGGSTHAHWTFPKGHPKQNETDLGAASRETEEKTAAAVGKIYPDIYTEVGWPCVHT
eukprot:7942708-Alexandrium_andersonii.AAC.1